MHRPLQTLLAAALAAAPAVRAAAADDSQQQQHLEPVLVTGARSSAPPPDLPHSSAGKSADQLREQNLVNPEDALKYLPSTTLRKRYSGDRNALIGGRSFGTLQPSRALVYVDGFLISNFLGRFDAPRWNMLTPESVERVDVLYGPFSALYPGNSIGTTVAVTERRPRAFEAAVRLSRFRQHFDAYGHAGHYDGHQQSAHLGDRLDSGLWYTVDLNRQDATSQPMQYQAVTADAAGRFPEPRPGPTTPVTGVRYDTDPRGLRRALLGAGAGAIDHTVQQTVKLRLGQTLDRALAGDLLLAHWTQRSQTRNLSFLRDGSGQAVWRGLVSDGAQRFELPATALAPSRRDERHLQAGLRLKTQHDTGWNATLVLSGYRIIEDRQRQATLPDPQAGAGGAGSVTRRDGTGWNTAELVTTYTPAADDLAGGRHALTFGLHRNAYRLRSTVDRTADWRGGPGHPDQYYRGRTRVVALYGQDVWRLRPDLKLTWGVRWERFEAGDGQQKFPGSEPEPRYPSRRLHGSSPKASLAWWATPDLLLKASAGRGVRFPNVEELYNGSIAANGRKTSSDPHLAPERSDALELSAEYGWQRHLLRASLFQDDVQDAILRQNDVSAQIDWVSNVDRVRTRGIELAWQAQDWPARGLSLDANVALARSKVAANARDPRSVGKYWPRVPRLRASVVAAWRANERWTTSLALRHSGRAYNTSDNSDIQPDVYGGVSRLTQLDLRGSVKLQPQLELALGIDNLGDQRAWQSHPYPGRTLLAELRWTR